MKHVLALLLVLPAALPATVASAEQMIPGGSVMQCMVSEPNISSKTTHIGDPVICRLMHEEMYGRSTVPYGSYLIGRFEDYKDPGHFVGKGWLELKFDRMVVGNDTVIPVTTRVVATPKYPVDIDGRIQGKGHPVRDIVEWSIPLLWPIDLINLPRRGPRPVLGPETKLTVKILDDIGVPTKREIAEAKELTDGPALHARETPAQQTYAPAPSYGPAQTYGPAPIERAYAQQPAQNVVIVQAPAPQAPVIVQAAAPAPQPVIVQQPVAPVYYGYPPPPPPYAYWRPY